MRRAGQQRSVTLIEDFSGDQNHAQRRGPSRAVTLQSAAGQNEPVPDVLEQSAPLRFHPSLHELQNRNSTEEVEDFRVSNDYGSITWLEPVDLSEDLHRLAEIVLINPTEVTVYPDGSPERGTGLNRPARVELKGVFALDRDGKVVHDGQHALKYGRMLSQSATEAGARHIDWNKDTGLWRFKVEHFSKIGMNMDLMSDSESDEDVALDQSEDEQAAGGMAVDGFPQPDTSHSLFGASAAAPIPDQQQHAETEAINLNKRRMMRTMVFPQFKPPDFNDLTGPKAATLTAEQKRKYLQDQFVDLQLNRPEELILKDQELEVLCEQYFGRAASRDRQQNINALRLARSELFSMGSLPQIIDPDVAVQSDNKRRNAFQDTPAALNNDTNTFNSVLAIAHVKQRAKHVPWAELHLQEDEHRNISRASQHFEEQRKQVEQERRSADNMASANLGGEEAEKKRIHSGLFMARSFRVGWGPNGELVHPGFRLNSNAPESRALTYSVKIEQVGVAHGLLTAGANDEDQEKSRDIDDALRTRCCKMLQVHKNLQEKPQPLEPHLLPALRMRQSSDNIQNLCSDLRQICEQPSDSRIEDTSRAGFLRHEGSLWSLVNILWGIPPNMSTRISPCEMTAKYTPALERLRRNALNVWLKECAQKYIDTDTSWQESSLEESIGMSKVMAALCANNLPKACKHAKDVGDLKLALLMSQSQVSSLKQNQRLLGRQMELWEKSNMFPKHFNLARRRLYQLLSGDVPAACKDIDQEVCPSLYQWRLRFGLYYWHRPTAAITQSVNRYNEELIRGEAVHPIPPHNTEFQEYASGGIEPLVSQWSQSLVGPQADGVAPILRTKKDTAYELLELYAARDQDTELQFACQALDPEGNTPLPLDVHTAWFLSEVVRMQGILKPSPDGQVNQQVSDKYRMLTAAFSQQLVLLGLWEWAVYVLLHLPSELGGSDDGGNHRPQMDRAVQDIIGRHLPVEPGLGGSDARLLSFGVPQIMLDESRAIRARYQADIQGESANRNYMLEQSIEYNIRCGKQWLQWKKMQGHANLQRADATLRLELCPAQVIREPPYYMVVQFDLRPAMLVIGQTLVNSGLLASEEGLGQLENRLRQDHSTLSFEIVVEIWESETWASTEDECVQEKQEQLIQNSIQSEGQAGTVCRQLGLALQLMDGKMMWRLDVSSKECQDSIIDDALGMDSARSEQFASHGQIHESVWKPCPDMIQHKEGVLRLDHQNAVVSIKENFALRRLKELKKLEETGQEAHFRNSDTFLKYMKLIRRQEHKEHTSQSDHDYLVRMKELRASVTYDGKDRKMAADTATSSNALRPPAYFNDGGDRPMPLHEDQQDLRAALDHVSKNLIKRCASNVQQEGEFRSELENIQLLKDIPALEADRMRMLHSACEDILSC